MLCASQVLCMQKAQIIVTDGDRLQVWLPQLMQFCKQFEIPIILPASVLGDHSDRMGKSLRKIELMNVGEEGSDSWNHVWQTVSYDIEKLSTYNSGMGNEEFRKGAIHSILDDIDVLVGMYTVDSLKLIPVVNTLVGLLQKCPDPLIQGSTSMTLLTKTE